MTSTTLRRLAAAFGFSGVGLGAFGAHALKEVLERNQATEIWKTAVLYHLVHAVALLCLVARPPRARLPALLFAAGILIFSGSLYLYALTLFRPAALVTPLGGLCLLAAWLALLWERE